MSCVRYPSGAACVWDRVATIVDTIADRSQAALLDGKPAIGFSIYRSKGFDETIVATQVRKVLADLAAADDDLSIDEISGTVDHTLEQYNGSMTMLWEGAALAVLVVFLFLRDVRATFIAASALPLAIIPTFAVMSWLGFSLNTVSLLALALVVGILVDDAIVEIENTVRHLPLGPQGCPDHRTHNT